MAVTDPRYKLVSVRLSAVEYAEAEEVSLKHGYRSLSAFARSAILAFILAPNSATEQDLRRRIDQLSAELRRLSQSLEPPIEIPGLATAPSKTRK